VAGQACQGGTALSKTAKQGSDRTKTGAHPTRVSQHRGEGHNGGESGRAGRPRRCGAVKVSQAGRGQASTNRHTRALQRRAGQNQNRQPAAVANTDH